MENSPAVLNQTQSLSVFDTIQGFEQAQRICAPLAKSTMIPAAYQNNVPNCMIALEMAHRLNLSPLMVMQNVSIIHGKASMDSKFIIGLANSSNRFLDPLDFRLEGEGDQRTCRAFTRRKDGREVVGPEVSIQMAILEGWMGKAGSKWKTMPELMLQYRAAAFFARLHCPDVLMGMQTGDEVFEIGAEELVRKSETISHINNTEHHDFVEITPEINEKEVTGETVVGQSESVAQDMSIPEEEEEF